MPKSNSRILKHVHSTLGLKLKQNLRKFYTVDSSLLFFFVFAKFGFRFGFLHNFLENRKKPYIYCTALVRKSMKKYPLKMHNILIIRVISSNMIILFFSS